MDAGMQRSIDVFPCMTELGKWYCLMLGSGTDRASLYSKVCV